ncbi:hypothetical protein [Pedobacter insulae]|uniref:Uncharacterized protein n=1 Tax=Pedobacter insulae TaxID=414048 RepID=A0A1I2XGC5_9SPHI|nr:hypothetical protein [Pedobacter insulae]SFH12495.1 hypothetical protein SAMN04489864_105225 [Pedobacter insulae]
MKNLILIITLLFTLTACSQEQKNGLQIALCEKEKGCAIILAKWSKQELSQILKRPDLISSAKENSIIVMEKCVFKNEYKLTMQQLHEAYGGKGNPEKKVNFDIEKYLLKNNCICTNPTKKFTVTISTPELSGSSYFFLSWDKNESYFPNEAFQQLYADQEGAQEMTMDSFLRNGEYFGYASHPSYGKIISKTPTGVGNFGPNAKGGLSEKWFKNNFKPTGNKRPHLNTRDVQKEYKGIDSEGKSITFWLGPSYDVCLAPGKFEALGIFFVGYIAVDGITYSLMEVSGPTYKVQVTGIENGSYNFNPAGYKSMN